jgi:phenylpropionate dioxygenase-like ring-hydroxylating dioxygenase large terminal subunit
MSAKRPPFLTKPYSGYFHQEVPEDDRELTRVGPGTPAGEYLRRFWQPILLTQQIKDLPVAIKRFGEELVAYRDKSGRIGLVEAHCPHRGTSLEYGKIEERGIRCCYHSWLIDLDGRILETPGEPEDSTFKDRLYHGAYPAIDYNGIVFAYMGPPDKMPEFPTFDLYETPGYHLEAGIHLAPTEDGPAPNPKPCNWLQIVDNFLDPIHEEFLHATISGIQFVNKEGSPVEELAINGELGFLETSTGIITLDSRRINQDTVWVRNIEFNWPNMAVLGGMPSFPHEWGPDQTEQHEVPSSLFWAVPVDDYNSIEIDFFQAPDRSAPPPARKFAPAQEANRGGRAYERMQRMPGDYEAMIGQRPIAVHALEHLGAEDRGVTMLRKGLRHRIRMVQQGQEPPELAALSGRTVSTHAGDTLLRVAEAGTPKEDKKLLRKVGIDLAQHYVQNPPNTRSGENGS